MESLSPDIVRKIALELPTTDFIKLCATNKKFHVDICESKDFWRAKLRRDYPESFLTFYISGGKLPLINPKKTYVRQFNRIVKFLENRIEKYTTDTKLRKLLLQTAYNAYLYIKDRYGFPPKHTFDLLNEIYRTEIISDALSANCYITQDPDDILHNALFSLTMKEDRYLKERKQVLEYMKK